MAWASTTGTSCSALLLGNYIYITANEGGRPQRVDITNQTTTSFTSFNANTYGLATYNNNLYFGSDGQQNVYVTNQSGTLIQTITFGQNIKGIAIYGNFLYAVTFGGSNQIIKYNLLNNTTDATWGTTTLGTINVSSIWSVTIYNNIMYLCDRGVSFNTDRISKIDLSTNIAVWNWVSVRDPTNALGYGDYLYVSSYFGNAAYKIDLTATTPSAVNIYSLSAAHCPIQLNGYLYVLSYSGGIYQTNIVMPASASPTPSTPLPCFLENTGILTDKGLRPIQQLRKGDLVLTLRNGFLPIDMIGKKKIYHPASEDRLKEQLYKCTSNYFPEVLEDLIITGCHSILVDDFTSQEQKNKVLELYQKIYVTDAKYRLPACIDERATVYENAGHYTIYHLALENEHYYSNYGIYANGLLVESCSKRYLKELSDMELIE
jgi:hypothetical protein